MLEIAAYYDGWRERQLADYEVRNARVVSALDFARPFLPLGGRVLDVGCGIGWTTDVLRRSGFEAIGLDIAPALIETARETFPACEFILGDITESTVEGCFDGITLIDVYEHIAPDARPAAHEQLARLLRGVLVLTVPTPATQQYAREHGIQLQPIDEDITDAEIAALAEALEGEIIADETVSIWRDDDYRHTAVLNA